MLTALVAASLAGSTMIAAAQTQPAPGASGQGEVGPDATNTKMKKSKKTVGSSMMKNDPNAKANPDATGQGTVGPGTTKK
jgi:hypothetical protein